MKHILSILPLVLLFAGCKKDKKTEPTPASGQGMGQQEARRIRNIRMVYTNAGNISFIRNLNAYYNTKGQLEKNVEIDSSYQAASWTADQFVSTFTYTDFNRIKEQNNSLFKLEYVYDENRRLKYEIWTENSSDTVKYTYTPKQTISISVSAGRTSKCFYSQNLDSVIVYDDNGRITERTVYSYNAATNLVYSYTNQFYTVSTKNELTQTLSEDFTTSPATRVIYAFTRTYNANKYPLTETVTMNGNLQSVSYYSYY